MTSIDNSTNSQNATSVYGPPTKEQAIKMLLAKGDKLTRSDILSIKQWANQPPKDLAYVISQLSDNELKTLLSQIYDNDRWFPLFREGDGLNRSERDTVLASVTKAASAEQLKMLYAMLASVKHFAQTELLSAIQNHSSVEVRAALAKQLAADATDDSRWHADSLATPPYTDVAHHWDKEAGTLLSLLIGLKNDPAKFLEVMETLSDKQLAAVLQAGSGKTVTVEHLQHFTIDPFENMQHKSFEFNDTQAAELVTVVSQQGDAKLKARVFELAAVRLRAASLQSSNLPKLTNELNDMLNKDTVAIITALERNEALIDAGAPHTKHGKGLSLYMAELVRTGQTKQITQVISVVRGDKQADGPVAYLEHPDNEKNYQNASNLGLVTGAVRAGVDILNRDWQKQVDTLDFIFSKALIVMPRGKGVIRNWPVGKETSGAIINLMRNHGLSLDKAIIQTAWPAEARNSQPWGAFKTSMDAVVERGK